jgi:hypothetical protein
MDQGVTTHYHFYYSHPALILCPVRAAVQVLGWGLVGVDLGMPRSAPRLTNNGRYMVGDCGSTQRHNLVRSAAEQLHIPSRCVSEVRLARFGLRTISRGTDFTFYVIDYTQTRLGLTNGNLKFALNLLRCFAHLSRTICRCIHSIHDCRSKCTIL